MQSNSTVYDFNSSQSKTKVICEVLTGECFHEYLSECICRRVSTTYRRLIPDSGWAEDRERVLSSGEGEGEGVTISSSVSSLQKTGRHNYQQLSVTLQRMYLLG